MKSVQFFALILSILCLPVLADTVTSPLSIEVIRSSPELYDGKNIKVSGQVRSLNPSRGKRGSEFMVLVLENSNFQPGDSSQTLTVFSYFTPPLKKGGRVIVTGVYHKTGYWAGSTHDHFIEASKITPIEMN
ncbi:MAG: hypothetical protein HY036_11065 [Nitrospirae bacterium]|nr:hypothetical protein [Nitrospirota bacterium]MBI3353102.1 hypothetical protein [Nitrospirota bacterium]